MQVTIGAAGARVDTDTGEIAGVRAPGVGVVAGIDFAIRDGVGVFRFADLRVDAAGQPSNHRSAGGGGGVGIIRLNHVQRLYAPPACSCCPMSRIRSRPLSSG